MSKKINKLLILEILLFSFLCGCGSDNVVGGKDDVKILLSVNQMDTFRQTLVDAALIRVEEEGATLDDKADDETNLRTVMKLLLNHVI